MIIIDNKKIKIEKSSTFTHYLHVHGEKENKKHLIVSLLMSKLMPGAIYNNETEEVSFVAETVNTLENTLKSYKDKKMPYNTCVRMIYCISKQLDELEKTRKFF